MADKKYYWLKLQKDFFKRHDIKIIENMPNGKDYILFYLKLLLESISHEGSLRFSEAIPYSEEMLSVITDTNIDIVRSAMKLFVELKMVEVLEDSTLFMAEVTKMIGCETSVAERVRKHRALHCNNVKQICNTEKEIELEIELDKEIEIDSKEKRKRFVPSVKEDIYKDYCKDNIDLLQAFKDWEEMRKNIKKPLNDRARKLSISALEKITKDPGKQIEIINQSTLRCWQTFYELKEDKNFEGREVDEIEIKYKM